MTNIKDIVFSDFQTTELKELRDNINAYFKANKTAIKEANKANKEAETAKRNEAGKAFVENAGGIGAVIPVAYKGETVEGTVTKMGEKTVSLIVKINDEDTKVWRYFHQVVTDEIETDEDETDEDETDEDA
jgi:hypothetical protein